MEFLENTCNRFYSAWTTLNSGKTGIPANRVSRRKKPVEPENTESKLRGNEQTPVPENGDPSPSQQLSPQGASTERSPKGGGPRTPQGKNKSSRNSLKHGIFSNIAILKGKSRSQFNSLLHGLYDHFEPKGTCEEVLVDKLAVILWCERQVFIALVERPLSDDLAFSIGGAPPFDLALRYLTTLDRAADRIFSQLERLQSIRKGQPLPPTLNVNVSA